MSPTNFDAKSPLISCDKGQGGTSNNEWRECQRGLHVYNGVVEKGPLIEFEQDAGSEEKWTRLGKEASKVVDGAIAGLMAQRIG